jgi:hypothetical protein
MPKFQHKNDDSKSKYEEILTGKKSHKRVRSDEDYIERHKYRDNTSSSDDDSDNEEQQTNTNKLTWFN